MRRDFIFYGGLLSLTWVLAIWSPRPSVSQKAQKQPLPSPLPTPLKSPPSVRTELCQAWDFRLIEGQKLSSQLEEMSGLAWSAHWEESLYHVSDSGNRPELLVTTAEGLLQRAIPYAERQSDVEDISRGPCPWPGQGGSCLYIADSGDNFKLRSDHQIHIVEEASLYGPAPRRETLHYVYPEQQRFDVEAMAVHPQTGHILLFTKEKEQSQVFELKKPFGAGVQTAAALATLPLSSVTGAAFHPAGERLLLLNRKGATELATGALSGFEKRDRSWFPYQRRIKVLALGQQEAISYTPSGLSFIYSGERRGWSKKLWGLVNARCLEPADADFPR